MKNIFLSLFLFAAVSMAAQNETLNVPNGTSGISSTTNNRGVAVGPGFDTPDATLHVMDKTENGTALILEARNDQVDPPGEGGGPPIIVTPDYFIKGQYKDFQLPGSPSVLFSVDLDGKIQSGFHEPLVTDQLAIRNNMGIYASVNRNLRFDMLGGEARMIWESPGDNFQFVNGDNSTVALQLGENGQVGINTGNFFGDHDLFVDGSVYIYEDTTDTSQYSLLIEGTAVAEEMFILLNDGSWGDFVFEEDYDLMPLDVLERYLDENKHLPGFKSASEIEKNGVPLGETERQLTIKVEELTLYILELKKEIGSTLTFLDRFS